MAIELSSRSDFGHQTPKPDIIGHQTINLDNFGPQLVSKVVFFTVSKVVLPTIFLGRNPLSDAPYRNPGMVLNGQGPGRHPRDAPCRDLGMVSSEQGSGRRFEWRATSAPGCSEK